MEYAAKDIEQNLAKLSRGARAVKILLRVIAVAVIGIWAGLAALVSSSMLTVASYNFSLSNAVFSFMQWAAIAAVLWTLSDIFGEAACNRTPFSAASVRKLRIAAAITLLALAANVLSPAWSISAINASGGYFSFNQEPNVVFNLNLETALLALLATVLLGMSAIFKYGAMLQSVSDDTV